MGPDLTRNKPDQHGSQVPSMTHWTNEPVTYREDTYYWEEIDNSVLDTWAVDM